MYKSLLIDKDSKIIFNRFNDIDKNIIRFISKYIDPTAQDTRIFETSTRFNIDAISPPVKNLVNLRKINRISWLNKFLESINKKLPFDGVYIGCVELYHERKKRIYRKYPNPFSFFIYLLDFIYHRVMPKIFITRRLYYFLSKGVTKALSLTETLGRLVYRGMDVMDFTEINNIMYFAAKKISTPFEEQEPSYGLIHKMDRVGKGGEIIKVMKLRTMNPYAEYIQNLIYEKNKLKDGGKFYNDFRITSYGKFFRKYWIDELPMILNYIKGDLKLVGVRPLSRHYFDLYAEELKEKRIKYKPGLVPPFYADMPKTLEQIMNSERKYFEGYEKHPFKTDFYYFFKSFYNIIFKKARSS